MNVVQKVLSETNTITTGHIVGVEALCIKKGNQAPDTYIVRAVCSCGFEDEAGFLVDPDHGTASGAVRKAWDRAGVHIEHRMSTDEPGAATLIDG